MFKCGHADCAKGFGTNTQCCFLAANDSVPLHNVNTSPNPKQAWAPSVDDSDFSFRQGWHFAI